MEAPDDDRRLRLEAEVEAVFDRLEAPFDPSEILWREGDGGKSYPYLKPYSIRRRFDQAVGRANWSKRSVPFELGVTCELTITLPDGSQVTRSGIGGYREMRKKQDVPKAGDTDAFKRAAEAFGVRAHTDGPGRQAPPQGRRDGGSDRRHQQAGQGRRDLGQPDGPQAETWGSWIHPVLREANEAWHREMLREGVEPRYVEQYRDLTMEPREVQFLATALLKAGEVRPDQLDKDGVPGTRDAAKCRAVVAAAFARDPQRVKDAVLRHLAAKRTKIRAAVGMAEADDEGGAVAEAVPGRGDAYEGA